MPFSISMPKLSPTMTEGIIAKWHKKVGDFVNSGDLLIEVATDKATIEYNALDEGWLRKVLFDEGSTVAVGATLALFSEEEHEELIIPEQKIEVQEPLPPPEKKEPILVQSESSERIKASPLAKKLAQTKNIDLKTIQGSGPGGRIVKKDLEQAKENAPVVHEELFIEEKLSPMRKVIADRLQYAKTTIPHFYIRQEIDATKLLTLRQEMKSLELSYTINDCITKACAKALTLHPDVHVGFNEQNKTLIVYKRVDISVAVTVSQGLITPIVQNADKKTLKEISEEVKKLAQKAKDGKLIPSEYQGGSFTISNLGMYGITSFDPILNPPQGGILGVGGVYETARFENGSWVAKKAMQLTLSCDHRVIDGANAALFMVTLKNLLENPVLFLVD